MTVQLLEIILILALVAWQGFVFFQNSQLIRRVGLIYPIEAQLGVETVEFDHPELDQLTTTEKVLRGLMSFVQQGQQLPEYRVADAPNEQAMLLVEHWDRVNNQWIPVDSVSRQLLIAQLADGTRQPASELTEALHYDALMVAGGTEEFNKIIAATNNYLRANKGAAADFNALRDISEREAELLEQQIEAQVSTPLYLGLLGTFAGAILGLSSLVNPFSDAATPFDDKAVMHFLGGVLIAMVGSLFGLGFTLWGNQRFKEARANRDRLKNDYYNFLQKALLPKLNSDMQQGLNQLKSVLDTFNQDFFAQIQGDFFSKIAEFTPLIGRITENISIQKDFLEKLQNIGYTQLANATIKVFDRVDESAATFEKFLGYQQALNVSVERGAQTVNTITALLNRMSSVEEALNSVPDYLNKHDSFVRNQVNVFTQHTQLLDLMRDGINESLSEDAAKMRQVLDNRLRAFDAESQAAAEKWNEHFHRINKDNVYEKIVEYLNPFQQLPAQQQQLNTLQETQAQRSAEALQAMQQQMELNRQLQDKLLQQTDRTNAVLEKLTSRNWLQRMVG
ncbi:hypothetical protein D0N36_04350 [Hymenobacter lapidiphilus]|uniref:hypothetical protein n=1 Tax=Hymenobacter sp. CCM 8763 TaxID=2303334 RepID=UPI000E34E51F|nr:hypothetical protein [Hymenobacter sp. CCM 8763]RFP66255.1 hypothetical protein D0N36_04350 [Hymenobacter sp. CCM 8763]